MARPRKMVEANKKHFTAAEREARLTSEAAHKVGREELLAFDRLEGMSDAAKAEYQRIATAAHWLDDLDRNDLIAYCINFDRASKIAASPDSAREILALTSSDGSKKLIRNPLWKAWQECCSEMRAISLKLGLATIDRLKLNAPLEETPINRWLKHLQEKERK